MLLFVSKHFKSIFKKNAEVPHSTFEYSSYCLGNRFANAVFQRYRCSSNLPFNVLYRMTKAFRTLQCYVIPICLCALYNPCEFVALRENHPVYSAAHCLGDCLPVSLARDSKAENSLPNFDDEHVKMIIHS
ncbi:hypothetical protein AVEN_23151-1 [Araneus ventricosus]|uniref:Uncharacterized protein n=1 Tax=Araneus ventricosus TaxID=182803 RepID=A0A4Y2FF86_ARAVE|nr:hypothetical protein AVEN_23151-1 [Araneus ventricosus]